MNTIKDNHRWLDEPLGENLGMLHKLEDKQMLIHMEHGGFSREDLWFLQDDDGEEYVVFPQKMFMRLLSRIKHMQEERLILNLEKDLMTQMPIDMADTMAVAQNILESMRLSDGYFPEINTVMLAKDIRKKHPNLFYDINHLRRSKR